VLAGLKMACVRAWMRHQDSHTSTAGNRAHEETVQRIAIWQFGGVGDMLLATPVIRALEKAYPDAEIHIWCSDPPFAQFLHRFSQVKSIHPFPIYDFDSRTLLRRRVRRVLRQLGAAMAIQKPDMLVNLHVPALLDWWAAEWWMIRRICPTRSLGFYPRFMHGESMLDVSLNAAERDGIHYTVLYRRLLAQAGIACDERTEFPLSEAEREKAVALVEELAPQAKRLVCMHIGARRLKVEGKMWPLESFAALAAKLVAEGYVPLLIGVASEGEMAEELCGKVPTCRNLTGRTSLGEMAALISLAEGFIGHDSGPFHVAVAVATPCVAISGRPDAEPEYLDYRRNDVAVLTGDAPEAITVDAVFEQAMRMFGHAA